MRPCNSSYLLGHGLFFPGCCIRQIHCLISHCLSTKEKSRQIFPNSDRILCTAKWAEKRMLPNWLAQLHALLSFQSFSNNNKNVGPPPPRHHHPEYMKELRCFYLDGIRTLKSEQEMLPPSLGALQTYQKQDLATFFKIKHQAKNFKSDRWKLKWPKSWPRTGQGIYIHRSVLGQAQLLKDCQHS